MITRCRNTLPLPLVMPRPTTFRVVPRLTNLERFQARDRFHRTYRTPLRLYQYQMEAVDEFMKKVLDCKGGTW